MKAGSIDWDGVKRRMEAADEAAERAWNPGPEEVLCILKKRADCLAVETANEKTGEGALEVLEFILDGERYAVESGYVRDVHPLEQLTRIPCTPDFVLGIVNLRGEILSVVDIRRFFGLPHIGLTDLNRLVVLERGDMQFCILVDAIAGVHSVRKEDIQPPMPALSGMDHIQGLLGHVIFLDAGKLLMDEKVIVAEEV